MKTFVLTFLAIIVFASITSALSTDLKPEYRPGETIIFELNGVILEPLFRDNIEFLRGHVIVEFQHQILKLGNRYFIYALSLSAENNYTFVIKDVVTLVNGTVQTQIMEQNFSLKGPLIDYNINPGAVLAQGDTEFTLTLNKDIDQTISVGNPQVSVILHPGLNNILIPFTDFAPGFQMFPFGMYQIPIYAVKSLPAPPLPPRIIYVSPERLDETFFIGRQRPLSFRVINRGDKELTTIVFSYNAEKYTLTPNNLAKLGVNQSIELNITLKKQNQSIIDIIRITSGNETAEFPINITYIENLTIINSITNGTSSNITQQNYYCEELNGKICSSAEECQGQLVSSLNGQCCRGTCVPIPKKSYAWLGYLFAALVLMILVIIGGRYWKAKHSSKDILKKRMDDAEKKFTS